MIVFKKIREFFSTDKLTNVKKDEEILFSGIPIDERGKELKNCLSTLYDKIININYCNDTDSFNITELSGEKKIKRNELNSYFSELIDDSITSISFESTTLGYCEILLILFTINALKMKVSIKIYYAEPIKYNSKNDNEEYELSEEYRNHKYIKPFILKSLNDTASPTDEYATLISLLGFEDNRLGRVINENEDKLKYNKLISIFPIPGFKFGWENISLSKHYMFLNNREDIFYTPADDPYEAYKLLMRITTNLDSKKTVILPIGTKPCTIGAAVFLINTYEKEKFKIATKYDFPIKKEGRSIGIDKIYEYQLIIK